MKKITLLVLVLLIIGGYYFYNQKQIVDIAGWQTYRGTVGTNPNLFRNVEFMYPPDWKANEFFWSSRQEIEPYPGEIAVGVDLVDSNGIYQIILFGSRSNSDSGPCEYRNGIEQALVSKCVSFSEGNIGDVRTLSEDPVVLEIFNQVVSSIKITK